MTRIRLSPWLAALVGTVVVACGTFSIAAAVDRDPSRSSRADDVSVTSIGGAQAPNARLAALINSGGSPVRTKGVASISRIDVGVYCIQPRADAGISVSSAIVLVSPEYYYSDRNEVQVMWATRGSGCPAGRIGVYTMSDPNADGTYSFTDEVGFSIIVP